MIQRAALPKERTAPSKSPRRFRRHKPRRQLSRRRSQCELLEDRRLLAAVPPIALADTITLGEDATTISVSSLTASLLANDSIGTGSTQPASQLSIQSFDQTGSLGGTLNQAGNLITYAPPSSSSASNETFQYVLDDGECTTTGTFQVQFLPATAVTDGGFGNGLIDIEFSPDGATFATVSEFSNATNFLGELIFGDLNLIDAFNSLSPSDGLELDAQGVMRVPLDGRPSDLEFSSDGSTIAVAAAGTGGSSGAILVVSGGRPTSLTAGDSPVDLAIANLDANAMTEEVASVSFRSGTIGYNNITTGQFTTVGTTENPQSIVAQDMNNDGLTDLVVSAVGYFDPQNANNFAPVIQLYLNQGGGSFSDPIEAPAPPRVVDLVVADLDDNGSPEILAASEQGTIWSYAFAGGSLTGMEIAQASIGLRSIDAQDNAFAVTNFSPGRLTTFQMNAVGMVQQSGAYPIEASRNAAFVPESAMTQAGLGGKAVAVASLYENNEFPGQVTVAGYVSLDDPLGAEVFRGFAQPVSSGIVTPPPQPSQSVGGRVALSAGPVDPADPGISGVTVFADTNGNGVLDGSDIAATTGSDGQYLLSVDSGVNTIIAVIPSGFNAPTATVINVNVAPNANVQNIDFGLSQTISGVKFADLNGDGLHDANEPGLSGVTVFVDLNENGALDVSEPSAITVSDGSYSIPIPGSGSFILREIVPTGFTQTFPGAPTSFAHTVVVDGSLLGSFDFGNQTIPPTLDFGDAPDSYSTTLQSGGPSHVVGNGLSIGTLVDADSDGTPSADALGDDTQNLDDEDGVTAGTLQAGITELIDIQLTSDGGGSTAFLSGWIDFNRNGVFDAVEQVVTDFPSTTTGLNQLSISVPADAVPGQTYGRFRYSLESGLGPTGPADSGEVEDHVFTIANPNIAMDYGDAPASYATLSASGGPSHILVAGLSIGASVDADQDGQPTNNATGDDSDGGDDEDGVIVSADLVRGLSGNFTVTTTNTTGSTAFLQIWIDLDRDGSFGDLGEQVVTNLPLASGTHDVPVTIPFTASEGTTFARIRYSQTPDLGFSGPAASGEVEDHVVFIEAPPILAVDDQFTVFRNSTVASLDVLANDAPNVTVANVITLAQSDPQGRLLNNTRGAVAFTGTQIFYTPPEGFVGRDQFAYTVLGSGTILVSVDVVDRPIPTAVDDIYRVGQLGTPIDLDVLANDLNADVSGWRILVATSGDVEISPGGDFLIYTPPENLNDTVQFDYAIGDGEGNFMTATVTIVPPASSDNDFVEFSIDILDLDLQPINVVNLNDEFLVQVSATDLRAPSQGFVSAFVDFLYDSDSVSLVGTPEIIPGILRDQGGLLQGLGPHELFTVQMSADAVGTTLFRADPSPTNPFPEPNATPNPNVTTVLFDSDPMPLTVDYLRFGTAELTIVPGGQGEFIQNPAMPVDVNDDGVVSPFDALLVLNRLGQLANPVFGESSSPVLHYVDVSGDGNITPYDVLLVLNELASIARAYGEYVSPASLNSSESESSDEVLNAASIDIALGETDRLNTEQTNIVVSNQAPVLASVNANDSEVNQDDDGLLETLATDVALNLT